MKAKRLLLLCTSLLLLAGCSCNKEPEIDAKFLERSSVALEIKGVAQFTYDPLKDQLSFNETQRLFRACNDTGTEYFTLSCDRLPTTKDQVIRGNLTYTRGNGVIQEPGLKLNVEKVQGDLVWLWNPDKQIALCVRTLR